MTRRATLGQAAHWALSDEETMVRAPAPAAGPEVIATLDDPALAEALTQSATFGRLSDGDIRAMRASRRRAMAGGAAALLLLTTGIGITATGWSGASSATHARYETRRGEQIDVALADGSRLHLDGATRLDVTMDGAQRIVDLRHGQAYFDVAHEAKRPFIVRAGGASTQVLGTAFNVEIERSGVRLGVYRGAVRFSGSRDAVVVRAGWRSRFANGSTAIPTRFDAAEQDWRQGWIDTDGSRLGDLVEALNRRGGRVIDPPSGALADIVLAGRFRLDNPEQLLSGVGAAYGFDVVRQGDTLRLVAAKSGVVKPTSE